MESRRQVEEEPGSRCASRTSPASTTTTSATSPTGSTRRSTPDLPVVSPCRVHLDHEHCLETAILKGTAARVRAFTDSIEAERGVRRPSPAISVEAGDAPDARRAPPRACTWLPRS
ncbi:MAG: hypothetical protein IPI27_10680 [Betaproteobacteria bacterium]|nr:hypothetical protein [Betaproteobacteria bacterium]